MDAKAAAKYALEGIWDVFASIIAVKPSSDAPETLFSKFIIPLFDGESCDRCKCRLRLIGACVTRGVIAITRGPYCFINVLYLALVRISAEEQQSIPEAHPLLTKLPLHTRSVRKHVKALRKRLFRYSCLHSRMAHKTPVK